MTATDDLLERLRAANPVPLEGLRGAAANADATKDALAGGRRRRPNGRRAALGSAVAVVAVAGLVAAVGLGLPSDRQSDDRQPSTLARVDAAVGQYSTPQTLVPAALVERLASAGRPELHPAGGPLRVEALLPLPEPENRGLAVALTAYRSASSVCAMLFLIRDDGTLPAVGAGGGCDLRPLTVPEPSLSLTSAQAYNGAVIVSGLVPAAATRVEVRTDEDTVVVELRGRTVSWAPNVQAFLADVPGARDARVFAGDTLVLKTSFGG